jgi:predicted transcriptional regulator
VADIAILLETRGIKRVPVLRAGKLVGIVSRANLIHALAMTVIEPVTGSASDDLAIREKLLAEMKVQRWAEVAPANVTVNDGIVHLWNSYVSDVEKQALLTLARSIPRVRGVKDHMRKVG